MKHKLLFIILLVIQTSFAQDTITIYYNQNWKEIKSIDKACYYRKFFGSNDNYIANDYYMNGNLQMIGNYKTKKGDFREGYFKYFFENGKIKSEGDYVKDKQNGKWRNYLENGEFDCEGEFLNGKKNGEWIWFSENGKICAKENYKKDKRIDYIFLEEKGNSVDILEAEHPATFEGGNENNFSKWILNNISYPKEAKGSTGTVLIEFNVNTKGIIENIKIVEHINEFLDNKAIKTVKSAPAWIPAKQHNKEINLLFKIPITFKY